MSIRGCVLRDDNVCLWGICNTNDHGYVPLVVSISRSFPHYLLITGFVTRLTRVPLVEQELLTLPEHLSSTPVFSGVRYLIFSFMCMFCRSLFVLLSFCTFFLWPLRCLLSSLIYGFWLSLWYLFKLFFTSWQHFKH